VAKSELEALGQEVKNVENGRLSAPVGAEQDGQRCDVFQFDRAQCTIVLDSQLLDPWWRGTSWLSHGVLRVIDARTFSFGVLALEPTY
jgi:hypothetical protein